METITEKQYKILVYISDHGVQEVVKCERDFNVADLNDCLKSGFIQRFQDYDTYWCDDHFYRITSKGRMEMNIFRNRVASPPPPPQRPEHACPRCWDTDESCPICCGYHLSKMSAKERKSRGC